MSNKLTVTYQRIPIINEKDIEGDAIISYKGSIVQTVSADNEVKLNTKDKFASDFITIAGEKLNTKGKIIKDFINVLVEKLSEKLNTPILSIDNQTIVIGTVPHADYYELYKDGTYLGKFDYNGGWIE